MTSMDYTFLALIFFAYAALMIATALCAENKGHGRFTGILLALLFSPLTGFLITVLLSRKKDMPQKPVIKPMLLGLSGIVAITLIIVVLMPLRGT